ATFVAMQQLSVGFANDSPAPLVSPRFRRLSGDLRQGDIVLYFLLRQRLRDLAGGVDESLGDRAQRAGLQGDDPNLLAGERQLDGQDFECRSPGEKLQCGSRKDREKTAGR